MPGLDPEEAGWAKRHPVVSTIFVIILIAVLGMGLKFLQEKYFPAETQEYKTPIFINESFDDLNRFFGVDTNLTDKQQKDLFDDKYRYNVFKWTCRPLSCQELVGKPTLKLICAESGFTEDLRIVMQENCTDVSGKPEVTVVFQLVSKTTGDYYLGRSGKVVE
ncbi:hypothetical protein KY363_05870 [Candidatus Woesearchaeota archaeon]|nr:hypothetical protein [Candidatus Woesearchaeota archaeon]